jgi:hypothetical protein
LSSFAHGVGQNPMPEVFGEDSLAVSIEFAEGDGSEAGGGRGEGESADPGEEVEVGWGIRLHTFLRIHSRINPAGPLRRRNQFPRAVA